MIQCWLPTTKQFSNCKSSGLTLYLAFSLLIFAVSCKNSESDLGLNLRADNGEIYSAETDTFTVNAFTVREDSIKTDSLSTNILGALYDPLFGISTSGVATQLAITQVDLSFGATPSVDSVLLYIRFDPGKTYGNLNSTQNMKVYYLNEKIEEGNKYFSNHKAVLGDEIGSWSGKYNTTDSVLLSEDSKVVKKAPGLLIKLYLKPGQDLANANPSVYASVSTFKDFMKGIVLVPQKGGLGSGQGAISAIDLFTGSSKMIVYFNKSLQHTFVMNTGCQNYNLYDITHTNPDIINQLGNPGKHYTTTYVQSMGGCKTKIEIPHILNLVKGLTNERVIINEAALIITPLNGSVSTNYTLPGRLNLFQPNADNNQNAAILDFLDYLDPNFGQYSIYGGSYNSLSGDYTIRFTRHLQNVLDKYITTQENLNRGFYVTIPSDQPITPTRLVLDNTRLPNYKALKFRITYSKIKT